MLTDTPGTDPQPLPRLRFRLLRLLAHWLPKREIRIDGLPYLERYYLCGPLSDATADLWPDGVSRLVFPWLRRTWYLHRFHRPDAGRALHDHPWDARGRILAGSYLEARATEAGLEHKVYSEGDRTHNYPGGYHRIIALLPDTPGDPLKETWTLLRVGPRVASWGFMVKGRHVDHVAYALLEEIHKGIADLVTRKLNRKDVQNA